MGAGRIEDAEPSLGEEPIVKRLAGSASQRTQDCTQPRPHVFPGGLAALDVDLDAAELAAGVQLVTECKQRGRLPRLPRRVQDEVLPLPDEQHEIVGVQTPERRNAVVHLRDDGTGSVEEAHASSMARRRRPRWGPDAGRSTRRDGTQVSGGGTGRSRLVLDEADGLHEMRARLIAARHRLVPEWGGAPTSTAWTVT